MPEEAKDSYGITDSQRIIMSRHGDVCGMTDCGVPPEQLCRACKFWYCTKHDQFHYKQFPDHVRSNA